MTKMQLTTQEPIAEEYVNFEIRHSLASPTQHYKDTIVIRLNTWSPTV